MKVKISRKIQIGAHTYLVKRQANLIVDDNRDALAHHRLGFIGVDSALKGTQRDEAFLHEINEIINRVWGCHLEHDNMDRLAEGHLVFLQQLGIEFDWSDISNE